MLPRGVYTQKMKAWGALERMCKEASIKIEELEILDDMGGEPVLATYSLMCRRLTKIGRCAFASDGVRQFQMFEAETNKERDWDIDEEGPVCNPVGK